MQIRLSDHFSFGRLLRFTLPSIAMMILTSLYSVADGLFVSNMVGDIGLSAVNIMFPVAMLIAAVGFMLGTGGSAVVARTLGEGRPDMANRFFSMFVFAVILFGGVLSAAGAAFVEPIARLAGASDILMDSCVSYGRILFAGSLPFMLQTSLQPFFVVAERPNMGLILSIASGVTNFAGDWVLIQLIGLPGAAQSALYSISNMTIQSAINGFGTVAVAAWSVYGKIDFLFWMTVSSFGIAVTTFAGQNFGARQYDRVRRGTMTCLAMTAGTTLCISLALYPSAQLLFRLFSSDDAVVAQGVQMMHYLVPVYMTYICIEIFSGALRGCGDVRVPTIITVFAVCIMRIVWLAVALPFKHELSVVEFSYPLTWITATVLFAIYYTKGGWMQRCIAAQNAKTQG